MSDNAEKSADGLAGRRDGSTTEQSQSLSQCQQDGDGDGHAALKTHDKTADKSNLYLSSKIISFKLLKSHNKTSLNLVTISKIKPWPTIY